MKKIAVITSTQKQFKEFLKSWVDYKDFDKFIFVNDVEKVYGLELCEVIRVGRYYELCDHSIIYEACLTRIR